jgi:SAM-dependent methyltransferase
MYSGLDQTMFSQRQDLASDAELEALPIWAEQVFPEGLARLSDGVWAPNSTTWSIAEQARRNLAGALRNGSGHPVGHFNHLFRQAIESGGLEVPRGGLMLDLCCGDGRRSVLPWLDLSPGLHVIASDPASVLLATLVSNLRSDGRADQVLPVLAEPESAPVAPGSIDVVSAISCLHEAQDPDRVLAAVAGWLRPRGQAILMVPFDGHGVLRVAYERICAEAPLWPEAPLTLSVERALKAMSADIAARTMPDTSSSEFGKLEQKWLFARESLEAAARLYGFKDVRFLPHNDHESLYRDVALVQLRAVTGAPSAELPGWALKILDGFDQALPPPVKRLLMLEGTVILQR